MTESEDEYSKITVLSMIGSAFAAAFGVQSRRNRERDFKSKSIVPFIIAGIVFTVLFVATVLLIVRLVLANAGQ